MPNIAVSACLLGEPVRYDGKHKYHALLAKELKKVCQLIPVCPEMGAGLGVPREKIQLVQVGSIIKLRQCNDSQQDITDELIQFSQQFIRNHELSGLILQDKSPSCGLGNTPLFSITNQKISLTNGLFAATIISVLPNLITSRPSQLQEKSDINDFIFRVKKYHQEYYA